MKRMRTRRTLAMGLALLFVLWAAAGAQPPDPRAQLERLLLTQEELIETLQDDGWVIKTVDRLDPEPEGGISVVATYANANKFLSLVIGLIQFESRELLDRFVEAIGEAPQLQGPPRDLLEEAQQNPEVLPELVLWQQETERVLLLTLEREQQQLLFQRHNLLAFLRLAQQAQGTLSPEERTALLLKASTRQLQKILDVCAELPPAEQPAYCAPLGTGSGSGQGS